VTPRIVQAELLNLLPHDHLDPRRSRRIATSGLRQKRPPRKTELATLENDRL